MIGVLPMTSYPKARRLYILEIGGAAALYVGALYARPPLLSHAAPGSALAQAVMLLPILPVWGMFWAVIRFYQRVDEYQRLELLKAVAFAAGIAACLYSSYPFAADAFGLKPLSMVYAWPILAVAWGLATAYIQLRNKAGRE